jgi:hypothetical protein
MTCSPFFSPPRTTQSPPCAEPICTGRGVALPSGPTTITVSPCGERDTACCGSSTAPLAFACSSRTRTYRPGSSVPLGLGTSARSVICPVAGSTVRSEKSSLPALGYWVPSSRTRCTSTPSSPPARCRRPCASAWRSFMTSPADCVKLTNMGLICWIIASGVASPWPTSAPSVTSARPMRPLIGAVTLA